MAVIGMAAKFASRWLFKARPAGCLTDAGTPSASVRDKTKAKYFEKSGLLSLN